MFDQRCDGDPFDPFEEGIVEPTPLWVYEDEDRFELQ